METQQAEIKQAGLGRDFWIYRLGQSLSLIGDAVGMLALGWWILEKTGSAAIMGTMLAIPMAIGVMLTPLFGPLGDRYSRKIIIAISDMIRAVVFVALGLCVWLDHFDKTLLVGLFTINTAAGALFSSSSRSIVTQLVERAMLKTAINKTEGINAVAGIVGGLVGGALVSVFGVMVAFGVNAATFVVATLCSLAIRANTKAGQSTQALGFKTWLNAVREGFRVVFQVRILFGLSLIVMFINFTVAPLEILIPYLVKQVEQLPAWYVGLLESGLALGSILGVLLFSVLAAKISLDRIMLMAFVLLGLCISSMALNIHIYQVLVCLVLIGVATVWANVVLSSQVMASVPDILRSRIGATLGFMGKGIEPVSMSAVGFGVDHLGFSYTLFGLGAVALVVAPCLYLLPHFKTFMRLEAEQAGDFLKSSYPVLDKVVKAGGL